MAVSCVVYSAVDAIAAPDLRYGIPIRRATEDAIHFSTRVTSTQSCTSIEHRSCTRQSERGQSELVSELQRTVTTTIAHEYTSDESAHRGQSTGGECLRTTSHEIEKKARGRVGIAHVVARDGRRRAVEGVLRAADRQRKADALRGAQQRPDTALCQVCTRTRACLVRVAVLPSSAGLGSAVRVWLERHDKHRDVVHRAARGGEVAQRASRAERVRGTQHRGRHLLLVDDVPEAVGGEDEVGVARRERDRRELWCRRDTVSETRERLRAKVRVRARVRVRVRARVRWA